MINFLFKIFCIPERMLVFGVLFLFNFSSVELLITFNISLYFRIHNEHLISQQYVFSGDSVSGYSNEEEEVNSEGNEDIDRYLSIEQQWMTAWSFLDFCKS